jgi:GH25 family lysozyme M1 (1,4-beta-N-acetylmuramidase)
MTPDTRNARRRRAGRLATTCAALVCLVAAGGATAAADVTGPDVSGHQHDGPLSWPAVKASGQSFVFIKATEGNTFTNRYFTSDYLAAREAGLIRGAYHYARPSEGTAVLQARRLIAQVGATRNRGELAPVLDLEETGGLSPVRLVEWARQFVEEVRRLTGRAAIIYTYPNFWRDAMAGTTEFTDHPLWIASYSRTPAPRMPLWPTWTFWQYTARGSLPGIAGTVDLNRFNGGLANLRQLANYPPTARITARLSTSTTTRRRPVTLSGTTTPALAGQTLYRQGYYSGAWHTWATTRVDASGRFRFTITPTVKAVNRYRVYLSSRSSRGPSASPTLTLTVR